MHLRGVGPESLGERAPGGRGQRPGRGEGGNRASRRARAVGPVSYAHACGITDAEIATFRNIMLEEE